jgi:hypothetical protein
LFRPSRQGKNFFFQRKKVGPGPERIVPPLSKPIGHRQHDDEADQGPLGASHYRKILLNNFLSHFLLTGAAIPPVLFFINFLFLFFVIHKKKVQLFIIRQN